MRQTFAEYLKRASQVRELSTPYMEQISSAESYGDTLKENFIRIGKLSVENRELIRDELFPMLEKIGTLGDDDLNDLMDFTESLLSEYRLRTLDPDLGWYIAEQFPVSLTDGEISVRKFRFLEIRLLAYYNMYLKTRRIEAVSGLSARFRNKGLEIMDYFESWLDKEKLASLPEESMRAIVITNSRFGHCMYEGERSDAAGRKKDIEGLEKLLSLSSDPEIRALLPEFDWAYHDFRTLEYLALSADYGNIRGFSLSERKHLYQYAHKFHEMWYSDPDYYGALTPAGRVDLAYLLNAYQAEYIDKETYQAELVQFLQNQKLNQQHAYERNSIYGIFHAALAYLICITGTPNPKEERELSLFYKKMMECVLHFQEATLESYVLEIVSLILEHFIDIPEVTFEQMTLTCMAALHTPSYIHSRMVAELTEFIVTKIAERWPELLIGLQNCTSAQEVFEKREELAAFARHASLVHDVGKIPIIDTIFVYERNLLDFEFHDIIKTHVLMGKYLLDRHESTRCFSVVAFGHHRWYDNSAGYPGVDFPDSSEKLLIDIVECVDCMEAATDFIGRSYSKGKTLEDFLDELRESSGSRYAPWLLDILEDPALREELREILTEERKQKYRDTYHLLGGAGDI